MKLSTMLVIQNRLDLSYRSGLEGVNTVANNDDEFGLTNDYDGGSGNGGR